MAAKFSFFQTKGRLFAVNFGLVAALISCSAGSENSMTSIPESAFPDPVVREAAQAIVNDDFLTQVQAAAAAGKIDYEGPDGDTLLLVAITGDRVEAVETLLRLGANPNVPADKAPLATATSVASTKIVQALLNAGANPNGKYVTEPAIWRAARANRGDVVKMLLERGVKVDEPNGHGDTPAMTAAKAENFKMVQYLLNAGADPFAVSSSGFSLGMWVSESRLEPGSDEGDAKAQVVKMLKERGHPWPPPGPQEVKAAQASGMWPPPLSKSN